MSSLPLGIRWTLRAALAPALAFALLAGGLFAEDPKKDEGKPKRESRGPDKAPKVGDVAPDFTLKSPDGKLEVKLSSFKGKTVLVNFWFHG